MKNAQRTTHNARRITILILTAGLFLSLTTSAWAATYYVDPVNGSDVNSGTEAAPWQTVTRAMPNYSGSPEVALGDTVYLRAGSYGDVIYDYNPTGTSWNDRILYKAYSGESPEFRQLTLYNIAGTAHRKYYLEFDGINVIDARRPAVRTSANSDSLVFIRNSACLKFKNMKIQGAGTKDDINTGDEANFKSYGLVVANTTSPAPTDIGRDYYIEGCELSGVMDAIQFYGAYTDTPIEIRNSYLHTCTASALQLGGKYPKSSPIIVENNQIYYQVIVSDFHGSGIALRTYPLIFRNNLIHNFGRTAAYYQYGDPPEGHQNMILENNLFYDYYNAANSVSMKYSGPGCKIINNTFISSHGGSTNHMWYYGNAFVASPATDYDMKGFEWYNNILVGRVQITNFANTNNGNNIAWYIDGYTAPGNEIDASNIVICTNSTDGDLAYFDQQGKFFVGGDKWGYHAQPNHNQDLTDHYQLSAVSPAIGYANSSKAPAKDLLGNTRDALSDVGCYEYVTFNRYYLDAVNGDDSNPGTSAAPWKTLAKAQSTVVSGDTVIVRNGSYGAYSESNLNRTDWVTYRAESGHHPILSSIKIDNPGSSYNAYLVFDGFNIISTGSVNFCTQIRNSAHFKLLHCEIVGMGGNVTAYGFYGWGTNGNTDVTIDGCTFSGGTKTGRFDGFINAIYATGIDYLTINNNEIRQCYGYGIFISCFNVTVTNNDIHFLGGDGIFLNGGAGPVLIENNKVHDLYLYQPALTEIPTATTWSVDGKTMTNPSATWGVNASVSWPVKIEIRINSGTNVKTGDNDIRVATVVSPTEIVLDASVKLDAAGATPANVDYFFISQTHGDLFQVGAGANTKNVTVRGNQFYDCYSQFWWVNPLVAANPGSMGGENFLVENNLFWNSYASALEEEGQTITLQHIHGLIFRNNTAIGQLDFEYSDNVQFYNNIVSYIRITDTVNLLVNDYNIMNRGSLWPPNNAIGPHTTFFYPGYSRDKWNDPIFTAIFADYANGDFQYASASSLGVGYGDQENHPATDILGHQRDTLPDVGCYEYDSGIIVIYGDLSGEGEVSAYDAALTAQAAVGLITLTAEQTQAADVSGEGEVSAYDAALIAQRAVGLISKFPVES